MIFNEKKHSIHSLMPLPYINKCNLNYMANFLIRARRWGARAALVVMLLCTIQTCAEVKMHYQQCADFVEAVTGHASGVADCLNDAFEHIHAPQEDFSRVEVELASACFHAESLNRYLDYRDPRYTILWFETHMLSGVTYAAAQPFHDLEQQLREIRDEYSETQDLSSQSLATIRKFADALSKFCNGLEGRALLSQKTFVNQLSTLGNTLYPSW